MKKLIGIFVSIIFISCSGCKENGLEEKEQTLKLSYIAWACDCANWAKPEDMLKYEEAQDTLADLSIFIEPADKKLSLPDTLGFSGDLIQFTGHFYKKKGFPKDYSSGEMPEKARVFRYTKYKVIRSNYKNYKEDSK